MRQFSHSVDAAHLGGRWIESRLGRKCLYGQIYQILLAVDNSSPTIYIVGCRGASQLGGSLLWIPPGSIQIDKYEKAHGVMVMVVTS